MILLSIIADRKVDSILLQFVPRGTECKKNCKKMEQKISARNATIPFLRRFCCDDFVAMFFSAIFLYSAFTLP